MPTTEAKAIEVRKPSTMQVRTHLERVARARPAWALAVAGVLGWLGGYLVKRLWRGRASPPVDARFGRWSVRRA